MANIKIKGKRVDYSAATFVVHTFNGQEVDLGRGVTGVDWSIKRSAKAEYGTGLNPLGQTEGRPTYSATLKMKWEEWENARIQIGTGYLRKRMHLTVVWKQKMDNGHREGKVDIAGFTILEESESAAADGTPEYTLTLLPDGITVDGIDPIGEA